MPMSDLNRVNESGAGRLYESNGFLIPVLTGSPREMGAQYGSLMREHMQKTYDVLVEPGRKAGAITEDDMKKWTDRAYSSFSTRNRLFYDGVVEATGWPREQVGILDQIMEYGIYQSKIHAFAGCTSILGWGDYSTDGEMYIGRNMDWSATFNEFPQVLTVWRPTDGSYRYANVGWPGVYSLFTALNEHGVYIDLHDGTSMGGSLIYIDRPSLLSALADVISESASMSAAIRRINGTANSASVILSLADESSGASIECSSLGGNRLRLPEEDAMVIVNTFLNPDWGLEKRETVSNSLRRLDNMTARLDEHRGKIDAAATRELMDLPLFDADGKFLENGGCTKPTTIDADSTVYQTVCDVKRRQLWIKVPAPSAFADWTHFDLATLWE